LVKSVLGFVSKGIMVVSNWFYAKYDGPVKLIKEGKVNEGIAALRSAVPGLNRSFSKTGGKDGTGA